MYIAETPNLSYIFISSYFQICGINLDENGFMDVFRGIYIVLLPTATNSFGCRK
jgi:hypothetical protein